CRSDESPPLQRRRFFPFPLKQLCPLHGRDGDFLFVTTSSRSAAMVAVSLPHRPSRTSRRSLSPRSPLNHRILRQSRRLPPSLQLSGSCCCSFSSEISAQFLFSARVTVYFCRNLLSLSQAFESCLEMSPLLLNEDLALPLNLLLPQFEDGLMLLKMEVLDGVSMEWMKPMTLKALQGRSFDVAGGPSFSIICWIFKASNSIVLFSALHSEMDLNEIAGCLLTNLATLFSPLSFNLYQCATLCLAVASAMYLP
ncbi:LOW QUALITY PROTEIN: hypothetical protein HID58_068059, partial [Brassica napus]